MSSADRVRVSCASTTGHRMVGAVGSGFHHVEVTQKHELSSLRDVGHVVFLGPATPSHTNSVEPSIPKPKGPCIA